MPQILDQFGKPLQRATSPRPAGMRATYDAAETTDENYKHWSRADNLSPNVANNVGVRRTLRNRARYERANNPYCKGLVSTIAADTIGTGPRLSLTIPGVSSTKIQQVEGTFANWCLATNFADKLRVKCEAKIVDGDSVSLLFTNPRVEHPVKLDVRTYEADQCTTPFLDSFDPLAVDGLRLDKYGNAIEYHLLKYRPSGMGGMIPWDYDKIDAKAILHWFRPDRPGQMRGVSEIASALPLFAYLRRYTLASVAAAEIAAMLAGIMYTDQPADGNGQGEGPKLYDAIELVRGMLLSLPEGWKAEQFGAKQPAPAYKEFKGEILCEIARSVNATFNIIAGNSSGYNYSSGRLDHVIYFRSIRVERHRMRWHILDRLLRAWLEEAMFVEGLLPDGLPPFCTWTWDWYWDGFESIDPLKDATSNVVLLQSNQTTLKEIYAEYGQDWEPHLRQRARELALCAELGISPVQAVPTATTSSPKRKPIDDAPADEDEANGEDDDASMKQAWAIGEAMLDSEVEYAYS